MLVTPEDKGAVELTIMATEARQTLLWTPKTKDRPRSGRGHMYTPKATIDAEQALAAQWNKRIMDGPLEMFVEFTNHDVFVELRKCADYTNRKLTGDTDNYLKLVQDALNGVAYHDDKQIRRITGVKL